MWGTEDSECRILEDSDEERDKAFDDADDDDNQPFTSKYPVTRQRKHVNFVLKTDVQSEKPSDGCAAESKTDGQINSHTFSGPPCSDDLAPIFSIVHRFVESGGVIINKDIELSGSGEAKNGVTKRGVTKSAKIKSGVTKSGETIRGTTKNDRTKSGGTKSGMTKSGINKSGVSKNDVTKSGRTKNGISKCGKTKGSVTKSGVTKRDVSKSNMTKSGLTKSSPNKSGVTKSGVTKSGMTKNGVDISDVTEIEKSEQLNGLSLKSDGNEVPSAPTISTTQTAPTVPTVPTAPTSPIAEAFTSHSSEINSFKKPFLCNLCGVRVKNKYILKRHKARHLPTEEHYKCQYCSFTTDTSSHLQQHMEGVHPKTSVLYKCPLCNFRTMTEKRRLEHIEGHANNVSLPCDTCGKIFYHKRDLQIHVKQHRRTTPAKKNFVCPCGKRFPSRQILTNHLATHTGEAAFHCRICGVGRSSVWRAVKHFAKCHPDEKVFHCVDCDFSTNSLLEKNKHYNSLSHMEKASGT